MTLSREEYLEGVGEVAARSASPDAPSPIHVLAASARLCAVTVEHTASRVTRSGSGQRFLAKLALRPSSSLLPERPWEKAIMLATAALDEDPDLLASLVDVDSPDVDELVVVLHHQVVAGSLLVLERATGEVPVVAFRELVASL